MAGVQTVTDCIPCPPQKSKSLPKPAKRWNCENELHKRLSNLKRELDKFKEKLAKITRRARAKLRREFQEYVEEVPQVGVVREPAELGKSAHAEGPFPGLGKVCKTWVKLFWVWEKYGWNHSVGGVSTTAVWNGCNQSIHSTTVGFAALPV